MLKNKKSQTKRNFQFSILNFQLRNSVFLAFVQKEFYHIFRDRWTMIILLILPIVMLILFGYAITTEIRNTNIAIYDPSQDIATQEILNKLQVSSYFKITKVLNNIDEVENTFQEGNIGLVIVISENFYQNILHTGEAKVQIIADASDPNNATTLTNYATSIISAYQQELLEIEKIPFQIKSEVKLLYNPQMKGAYNFVPGVLGMILLLICAIMTSVSIAKEKETGTMEILLVSPMKPLLIIISKVVPYFALSIINLTTVLLLSVYVLEVPIAGSLFWLIVISLIYIFMALALGLLISSVVSSQLLALLISGMALMLPVMLLSGMMFPTENMPWLLRAISQIVPAKWYILAVKKLMIKGLGVTSIYKELTILSSMALFFIVVSLKKFKNRLE